MNSRKAPIAVALDLETFSDIQRIATAVSPYVNILKIGLQTYYRDGEKAIDLVRDLDCELFLDLKLHDIPNTVKGACKSLQRFQPEYLTVHASGGRDMVHAAVNEMLSTKITAVTALTSLSQVDLDAWGKISLAHFAEALAQTASEAGARAIVCSGHEIAGIRASVGPALSIVVPGIRNASAAVDDQQRTMTLSKAIHQGADVVVIGRPITHAADPAHMAQQFAQEFWACDAK